MLLFIAHYDNESCNIGLILVTYKVSLSIYIYIYIYIHVYIYIYIMHGGIIISITGMAK